MAQPAARTAGPGGTTPDGYRWLVLAMVFLVHGTAIGLVWQAIPPLKAVLANDVGTTASTVVLVFAAINFTLLLFQLPGGLLGDRFALRYVVGVGAVLTGVATAARGLFPDLVGLLATSVLAGVGMSLVNPNLVKIVTEWFAAEELGLAQGVTIAGNTVGSGLAGSLSAGALLVALGSWERVFLAYGVLTAGLGVAWLLLVRSPSRHETPEYAHDEMATLLHEGESARDALKGVFGARSTLPAVALTAVAFWAILGSLGVLPEYADAQPFAVSEVFLGTPLFVATFGALSLPLLAGRIGQSGVFYLSATGLASGIVLTGLAGSLPTFLAGMVVAGYFGGGMLAMIYLLPGHLRDIGPARAGTMSGVLLSLGMLGGTVGPIVGATVLESTGLFESALLVALPLVVVLPCTYRLRLDDDTPVPSPAGTAGTDGRAD
ncbi:MFS transporter [Salinirubellus salinus]|uniref:MFS transporter n=1 Tax=Salinirubellus salinus TaxID=1364945 RepID=A0A9E7U610_9EURY|nr:MFS transporter [Salinirubellus salinus]UWM55995.1 MFS transporter [Salinirubellus salinus]